MKVRKIVILLILIFTAAIILTGLDIICFGNNAVPKRSDCIIILGCRVYGSTPSSFLKSRVEKGFELYKDGYGKYIIVSGGRGSGENISEAEAMKRYLVSKGMDSSKILIDDKSASTIANLINSKAIMKKNDLKTAVIVSNKYHLNRASLMAKHEGIEASCSGVFVASHKYDEALGYIREIPALFKYYIIKMRLKLF
ncbi:YdcF family protein [Clostridium sp. JN-1]|jgi:uncharacterized SAM-binding protein YcdF (DUF218 family)|uniref:YdcF family protein n=1 Tax=Clostridium sp. JN-1 TaxID=2483110 RepID=UPI000F0B06AB|nr:YdcF family protein [Clostridium sp. JN-1]